MVKSVREPLSFKESFLRDMKFLYPTRETAETMFGDDNGSFYLKHLIQVYFMGWAGGMKDIDETNILIPRLFDRSKFLADTNWLPDLTWHWWKS